MKLLQHLVAAWEEADLVAVDAALVERHAEALCGCGSDSDGREAATASAFGSRTPSPAGSVLSRLAKASAGSSRTPS